jgi:hypothetical protein
MEVKLSSKQSIRPDTDRQATAPRTQEAVSKAHPAERKVLLSWPPVLCHGEPAPQPSTAGLLSSPQVWLAKLDLWR